MFSVIGPLEKNITDFRLSILFCFWMIIEQKVFSINVFVKYENLSYALRRFWPKWCQEKLKTISPTIACLLNWIVLFWRCFLLWILQNRSSFAFLPRDNPEPNFCEILKKNFVLSTHSPCELKYCQAIRLTKIQATSKKSRWLVSELRLAL